MNSGRRRRQNKRTEGRREEVHRSSDASQEYLVSGNVSVELRFQRGQLHHIHKQVPGTTCSPTCLFTGLEIPMTSHPI